MLKLMVDAHLVLQVRNTMLQLGLVSKPVVLTKFTSFLPANAKKDSSEIIMESA